MPPVKKPPKNAFSFYMDEFIPRLKTEGLLGDLRSFKVWTIYMIHFSSDATGEKK